MPHRTRRRSGLTRVSLRLVILLILAAGALAAMACSEDDGMSLIHPERGVDGLWVRWTPPVDDVLGDLMPPPADTIFLVADGGGWWSREVPESMGIQPLRVSAPVRYERKGVALYLSPLVPPCEFCRTSGERMAALVPSARYAVRRPDGNHLVLAPVSGDTTSGLQYFVRRSTSRTIDE